MTGGTSDVPIPVVLMGLGDIGQAIARAALDRSDLEIVGAVDPAHAGRRLDDLLGTVAPHLSIAAQPEHAFARARGGVLLHATGSLFRDVLPQLEGAVRAGLHVVSTCEELAYPFEEAHGEEAERLADLCDAHGVAVVGTGVNPGFVLDRLPALLLQATPPPRRVHARRVVEASSRRAGLQRRTGAGLTEQAFGDAWQRGEVGHVGLAESAWLVADACGFDPEEVEVEEGVEALVADEPRPGGARPIAAGQVAGFEQVARAFVDGTERIRLELVIQFGAEDPHDEVEIEGARRLKLRIDGGLPGDEATARAVVSAAPALLQRQGLITVLELPVGR